MRRNMWFVVVLVAAVSACMDTYGPSLQPTQFSAPAISVWTPIADMTAGRYFTAAATAQDGTVWVFGGAGFVTTSERLDPATGIWHDGPGLPAARQGHAAATLPDGRILIIGGMDFGCFCRQSVLAFNPADESYTPVASLPVGRDNAAAVTALNGRTYAIGGSAGMGPINASVDVYYAATDTWNPVAPMSMPRMGLGAAAGRDGRIYVAGGTGTSGGPAFATATAEVYDPATDTWSAIADLPTPRYGLRMAAGADGHIYAMGGVDPDMNSLSSVVAYDPVGNTWTEVPTMNAARALGGVTLGLDGRIFMVGGIDVAVNTPFTSAETYMTALLNAVPVANAGDDVAAECFGDGADVVLDASASSDPDGDELTYEWRIGETVVGSGVTATVKFGMGEHVVTLVVTDPDGQSHSDQVVVTVADTQAPVINVTQYYTVMSPPNHKMRLAARIQVSDDCDASPQLNVQVTSDEPQNGSGAGNTPSDWLIMPMADGVQVWLRSERSGEGDGRVYTISASASDAAGNGASTEVMVTVPK